MVQVLIGEAARAINSIPSQDQGNQLQYVTDHTEIDADLE